jgi:hypothetical protein
MGYNDLTAKQGVSGTNLQNAVDIGLLIQKAQITRGSQLVTKDFANSTVFLNPTNSNYSTSGANQILTKEAITGSGSQRIVIASYDASQFGSTQSIQYSGNSGASWTINTSTGRFGWSTLEASPNGLYYVASDGPVFIYGNPASGAGNTNNDLYYQDFITSVGLSDNAQYMMYASGASRGDFAPYDGYGTLRVSIDSGATFTTQYQVPSDNYISAAAISGDGHQIFAFRQLNNVYSSGSGLLANFTYGGGIWESSFPVFLNYTTANACSMSYTGQYIVVACGDTYNNVNKIWVNNNGGGYLQWVGTAIAYVPDRTAVSGNGKSMIVCKYGATFVYTSTDYGVNWSTSTPLGGTGVNAVAVSQDGLTFAALGGAGNAGNTFATSGNGTTWAYGTAPSAYVYNFGTTFWSVMAM